MTQASFKDLQYQFAGHIRDPGHIDAPGDIEERRMAIYRELFFNNLNGFISNSFPVLKKITTESVWEDMVRDFMVNYRARTPLFPELSREFLQYLTDVRCNENDPPFMIELAHYEWVEVALAYAEADTESLFAETGDINAAIPQLSPVAWLLQYRFPVHQITPEFIPREAPDEPTLLLVNRNLNDEVRFSELNPINARMIEMVRDNETDDCMTILTRLAEECQHADVDGFCRFGMDMLTQFNTLGAIYFRT